MNDGGEGFGDLLFSNVMYIILVVLFFSGMLWYVGSQADGAVIWEDYYVKEIVKVVDFGNVGDDVCLDVHKATKIAKKNSIEFNDIFKIDNTKDEVCVKLINGGGTCLSYFNNVGVINLKLKLAQKVGGEDRNLLCFDIVDFVEVNGGNDEI